MATITPTRTRTRPPLTVEAVEAIVVELLADEEGCDPDELGRRLLAAGPQMPVDSLLMFDVLYAVEQRTGVRVKADKKTGRSMRSVRDFAHRVMEVANS